MRKHHPRRWTAVVALTVLVAAAAAYAAIPGPDGTIDACYGTTTGAVRIIDSDSGTCRPFEEPISWSKEVRAYRVLRATPDEVPVTVVGSGPFGFPEENGTHILEMQLPQGVYVADATIAARKGFGDGDFVCRVHNNVVFTIFTRTTLGNAAGHVKRNTVSGSGVFSIPAGGGTLTLECWQAPVPELPGSPSGEVPTVFYATLQASSVTKATIVRYPAGTTSELP